MGTSNLSSVMATSFKLISSELKVEFEIGDTDYDVVWSMENNNDEDAGGMVEENFGEGNEAKAEKEESNEENTEALKKEKEFSKQTAIFRESWGLQPPPVQSKEDDDEKDSSADDDQVVLSD